MKRVLKGLGLVLLVLVLAVGGLMVATFAGNGEVVDGRELGSARTVKDGYVSLFMLDVGEGKVALIDAGNDPAATAILAELARRKLGPDTVSAIFLTHGHSDHVAGVSKFPNAAVYALADEVPLAEGRVAPKGPITGPIGPHPYAVKVSHALTDGSTVAVGRATVTTFAVPGHTRGSAAYLVDGVLFLGDSADADSSGRVHEAKWVFSEDQTENRRALTALVARLQPRAAEVRWLALSHSGVLEGFEPLAAAFRSPTAP